MFFLSMILLAREIFSSRNEVSRQLDEAARLYQQTARVSLGRVEVKDYQRMGFTRGIVRFAANGKFLAAGTENGDILIMNQAGKTLW